MPQTFTQRLTITLPLIGVALLLAAVLLPVQFAIFAWGLAMVTFLTALACALTAQRQRRSEQPTERERTTSGASAIRGSDRHGDLDKRYGHAEYVEMLKRGENLQ